MTEHKDADRDLPISGRVVTHLPDPTPAILVGERQPPGFLLEGVIPEREMGLLSGEDGTFKTSIALAISGAVASGSSLFGCQTRTGPRNVLFVSEEDPADVLKNRLEAIAHGHGWPTSIVLGNVHLLAREGFTLDDADWRDHLRWYADVHECALVVFDPYAELTLAGENSNDDAKLNVRFFRSLTELGATVLVTHHFGKRAEGRSKRERIRGATALPAACRFIWVLERRSGNRLLLECVKMSRTDKPPPLLIEMAIRSDRAHPAVWSSARFDAVEKAQTDQTDAELVILEAIDNEPGIAAGVLKKLTAARGVDPVVFSQIKGRFERRGIVVVEEGRRGAKLHSLSETGSALLTDFQAIRRHGSDAEYAGSPGITGIGKGMPGQEGGSATRHPSSLEDAGPAAEGDNLDADLARPPARPVSPDRYADLLDVADRTWDAAWTLDEVRGGTAASEWTAVQVRDLWRAGSAGDPEAVTRLAEALERRLAEERVAC